MATATTSCYFCVCRCCSFHTCVCSSAHYCGVKMGTMPSHITSLTIVYSTVYSNANQRKYQSSASLAFVWGIHRSPVNSPHKWLVTRKIFPFDDVIMRTCIVSLRSNSTDFWHSASQAVACHIDTQQRLGEMASEPHHALES